MSTGFPLAAAASATIRVYASAPPNPKYLVARTRTFTRRGSRAGAGGEQIAVVPDPGEQAPDTVGGSDLRLPSKRPAHRCCIGDVHALIGRPPVLERHVEPAPGFPAEQVQQLQQRQRERRAAAGIVRTPPHAG